MQLSSVFGFSVLLLKFCTGHQSQYSGVRLNTRSSYTGLEILEFLISDQTESSTWIVKPGKSASSCKDEEIHVNLQRSGYPIVHFTNKTYPLGYVTDRKDVVSLNFSTKAPLKSFWLLNPLPGRWYLTAFLPYMDNRIAQMGLHLNCYYWYSVVVKNKLLENRESVQDGTWDTHIPLQIAGHRRLIYRLFLSPLTWKVHFVLKDCTGNITILVRSGSLPSVRQHDGLISCSTAFCSLNITDVLVSSWLYVVLENDQPSKANGNLFFHKSECVRKYGVLTQNDTEPCIIGPLLDIARFTASQSVQRVTMSIPVNTTVVIPFRLMPPVDISGTLTVIFSIFEGKPECFNILTMYLQHESIYIPGLSSDFLAHQQFNISTSSASMKVPYPQAGYWFMTLNVEICHDLNTSDSVMIDVWAKTDGCVDGRCSNGGKCDGIVTSGGSYYTSCSCITGWQGYDCTDDSHVTPRSLQLTEILFLTLSNLAFIPAIVVSVKRKFFTEALVYFSNMFFSAFYHACDVNNIYSVCIVPWSVLSFADFFCSILSFWATFLAVSQQSYPQVAFLHILGVMGIQFGVSYQRRSLWLFVVTAGVGLTIVVASLGKRCYQKRSCYPKSRLYWILFTVGVAFAGAGLCMFAFAETESNYYYTHSLWHIFMATSILFVLPFQAPWARKGDDNERLMADLPRARLLRGNNCLDLFCCFRRSRYTQDSSLLCSSGVI